MTNSRIFSRKPIKNHFLKLYALYYKRDDDEYWARILKWNKHPDLALLSFLDVGQKFWSLDIGGSGENGIGGGARGSISKIRDTHFTTAIETLQQLKTKFTPFEKLVVILVSVLGTLPMY